jgi:hypothetical protein
MQTQNGPTASWSTPVLLAAETEKPPLTRPPSSALHQLAFHLTRRRRRCGAGHNPPQVVRGEEVLHRNGPAQGSEEPVRIGLVAV